MVHMEYAFGSYEGQLPSYRGTIAESRYVTMRDGVDLAVEVVLPRGLHQGPGFRPFCSRRGIGGYDEEIFVRIPAEGKPTITVARNRVHTSHSDLPVIEGQQLPLC